MADLTAEAKRIMEQQQQAITFNTKTKKRQSAKTDGAAMK